MCNKCRVAAERDARREQWVAWRDKTGWTDRNRWKHIEAKYGLTEDQYFALLDAQGGVCAVCGGDEPGGRGMWHVDHDHSCCPGDHTCGRCLRGLICYPCNSALGMMKDDPVRLRAAAEYVERYSTRPPP